MSDRPSYKAIPWPPIRNVIIDLLRTAQQTRSINGFIEIDLSTALPLLEKHRRASGKAMSFMAYVIYCYGHALGENPNIQALRKGKKLILFEDADVNTLVEKKLPGGARVPVSYIVRQANRKSYFEINDEIRQAQRSSLEDDPNVKMRRRITKMPRLLRRLIWKRIEKDPFLLKKHRGTAGLTSVGSFTGNRMGFGIPISPMTFTLTVGATYDRLVMGPNGPENHKMLCLTGTVNHDILDGAPATRFMEYVAQLIETGYGLEQEAFDKHFSGAGAAAVI